jgi:hypothetical protein
MGLYFLRSSFLLVIPLIAGILLMISAWFLSYPLSIVSADDWLFNHIHFLYWIGLPLTLVSLYLIGLVSHNKTLHCVIAIGIFFAIFSLSYYYYMLPGSDAQLFRGLNEYFSESSSLVPDNKWHFYYEWPIFFVLTRILRIVTGLELTQLEFLLYAVIGCILVLGLQIYFSKNSKNFGFLSVIGFSIAMFSFINYQDVPFSLAFSILIIMIAIEKKFENSAILRSKTILLLLLFIGISLTHLFVSVFFIFYLLVQYLFNKNKKLVRKNYLNLLLTTIVIYFAVQIFQAPVSLNSTSRAIVNNLLSSDLTKTVQQVLSQNSVPIDTLAQSLSRISIILSASVCVFGFLMLFLRKKLTNVDKAFFFAGLIYLLIGTFLPILGSRAIPFIFIPLSLGVCYFLQGRKETVLKVALLVCIVLFTFISIHHAFIGEVHFQTKEVYSADNFMLRNYAWNNTASPKVIIDFRQSNYLVAFHADGAYFFGENSANFSELDKYDCIVYTMGLGKVLVTRNITIGDSIANSSFNLIYSNGYTTTFVNER